MKRLKQIALGVLGAGLLITGLFACSNDESNNPKQENEEQKSILQSKSLSNIKIGEIVNGEVRPLFKSEDFKTEFLKSNLLAEVEDVELNENYLTIIGKDKNDFSLVAIQVELTKDGSDLFFPSIEPPMQVLETHKCAGSNCSKCSFIRDKNDKIQGCKCGENVKGKSCNHSVEDEGNSGMYMQALQIIATVFSAVVLLI